MPDDRTMVTELATALGTLPLGDLTASLRSRPAEVRTTRRPGNAWRTSTDPGAWLRNSSWPSPMGAPWPAPTTGCGVGRPASSSGPAAGGPPATRSPPSTCGSTTSTWSAASTTRTSWPTRRRPGSSMGCWPPTADGTGATGLPPPPRTSTSACTGPVSTPPASPNCPRRPSSAPGTSTTGSGGRCPDAAIPTRPAARPTAHSAGRSAPPRPGTGCRRSRTRGPVPS